MNRCILGVSTALAILLACSVLAQSAGGDYEITKQTIDSGGGDSSGDDYQLTGTIGQADANAQSSAGGEYAVTEGFWARADDFLFSDEFEE